MSKNFVKTKTKYIIRLYCIISNSFCIIFKRYDLFTKILISNFLEHTYSTKEARIIGCVGILFNSSLTINLPKINPETLFFYPLSKVTAVFCCFPMWRRLRKQVLQLSASFFLSFKTYKFNLL